MRLAKGTTHTQHLPSLGKAALCSDRFGGGCQEAASHQPKSAGSTTERLQGRWSQRILEVALERGGWEEEREEGREVPLAGRLMME